MGVRFNPFMEVSKGPGDLTLSLSLFAWCLHFLSSSMRCVCVFYSSSRLALPNYRVDRHITFGLTLCVALGYYCAIQHLLLAYISNHERKYKYKSYHSIYVIIVN